MIYTNDNSTFNNTIIGCDEFAAYCCSFSHSVYLAFFELHPLNSYDLVKIIRAGHILNICAFGPFRER